MMIRAKNHSINDPIRQKTPQYTVPRPKSNLLYEQYYKNTRPKPQSKPKIFRQVHHEIFPNEKSGKEEIAKVNAFFAKKRKLKLEFEGKNKLSKVNSIKIFPGKKQQSSIKNLLIDPVIQPVHHERCLTTQNSFRQSQLDQSSIYRKNISSENTFHRIFKGDVHIQEKKKLMYKSNKFKKAKHDHLQDLMDNQLKYRDKDDNIAIKPNNVSYSLMVNEANQNCQRRLYSDYQ